MLCHKVVPIAADVMGRMISNTYCMKPEGHDGKCEELKDVVQQLPCGCKVMCEGHDDVQSIPRT